MKSFTESAVVAEEDHETENLRQREAVLISREIPNGHAASARTPTLSQVTQVIVIIAGVTAFAFFARPIVLPVLMAWVASMALKPPVTWLRAHCVPTLPAAAIVVGITCAAILCAIGYLGRPAADWIKSYPQAVPELKQKFEHLFRPVTRLNLPAPATVSVSTNQPVKFSLPASSPANDRIITTVFNWTGTALAGTIETIALLFLLLASGDLFMQKLVRVMPTLHDKKRAVELSHEIQQSISSYLFAVGIINLCLGAIVGAAFYLLGLPNPAMWAAVVTVVNFIPYFGPVVGICAVALAGLLSLDTVSLALAPAGAYLVAHLFEANLVTPYVLGRRFTLNPVIIFVFLILCIWLWGVIGAFLAVPILVTLKAICDRISTLSTVSELLGS